MWQIRVVEDDFDNPAGGFLLGRYLNDHEAYSAWGWHSNSNHGMVMLAPDGSIAKADEAAAQMLRLTKTGVQLKAVP